VSGWSLTYAYTAGQRVTQAWSASVTQTGTQVTATNVAWNGTLAPGASASFGLNGTHTGSNPRPAAFALNGAACTLA
jgi:cellulase/cellobiase CelA1